MSRVKEAIDELIEESYLLGLSEEEIRQDFKRFIDACYVVIQAKIKDRAVINGLTENLAREKTCILIADRTEAGGAMEMPEGAGKDSGDSFAEKVAHRKRMILKTIAEYDPKLVRLIDEHRFQGNYVEEEVGRTHFRLGKSPNWERVRLTLLKVGYAATVALIIVLIYLGFIQKP